MGDFELAQTTHQSGPYRYSHQQHSGSSVSSASVNVNDCSCQSFGLWTKPQTQAGGGTTDNGRVLRNLSSGGDPANPFVGVVNNDGMQLQTGAAPRGANNEPNNEP